MTRSGPARAAWLLLLVIGLAPGCAALSSSQACPAPQAPPGARVKGKVTAPKAVLGKPGDGSEAVSAAEVALVDASGEPLPDTFHARTDADGSYEVNRVPTGFAYAVGAQVMTPSGKTVAMSALLCRSTLSPPTSNVSSVP